jgi:membrane associated rhomboid family serine protease
MPDGSCVERLVRFGALDLARVWVDREWFRVAVAGWVHGSALHLALNVASLAFVWPWLQRALGGAGAALWVFSLGVLGGMAASLLAAEAAVVLGASGGVIAAATTLWWLRVHGDEATRARVKGISGRELGWNLAIVLGAGALLPGIAQAGHLGGAFVGAVAGFGRTRPRWRFAAPLLVAGSLWVAGTPRSSAGLWLRGHRSLERGEVTAAIVDFERVLRQSATPERANALAFALAEAGVRLDEAEALAREAVEALPQDPRVLDTLGWVLCRRGQGDAGARWLRRAQRQSDVEDPVIDAHVDGCAAAQVRG